MTEPDPLPPSARSPTRARVYFLIGVALWALVLFAVGSPLAFFRHFQVDELQNVYNASLLSRWEAHEATVNPQVYQALLGWITRDLAETSDVLLTFRAIFFVFFAVNFLLLAWGQPHFSGSGDRLLVLLGATGLVPLWDHGFEIRHDVLFLTGELGFFALAHRMVARSTISRREAMIAGALMVWMLVSAHKAPAYLLPLAPVLLWIGMERRDGRLAQRLGWMATWTAAGAGLATLAVAGVLLATGTWRPVMAGIFSFLIHLEDVPRDSAHRVVYDFFVLYPHLLVLSAMHLFFGARAFFLRPRWRWTHREVTWTFLVVATAVLWINPRPFPYNLLHFVPFVYLSTLDVVGGFARPRLGRVLLTALVVANGVGFVVAASNRPYLSFSNTRQLEYIRAAESLTAPDRDPVLDGVGMVVTRPPADRFWMVHSSFLDAYRRGERTQFRDIIADRAPPVLLLNYRIAWLPREDREAIARRYIQIERDFLVLGGVLAPGSRDLEILRSGRYFVAGPPSLTIDGRLLGGSGPVHLSRGSHSVAGASSRVGWHWLGPMLDAAPPLSPPPEEVPMFLPFP